MTGSRRWLWFALLSGIALALVPSFARRSFDTASALAQTRAPLIQVLDGSTVVPNTGGTPGMPVQFPSTSPGTPVSKDFTINNLGDADLFLNDLLLPTGFTGEFVGSGTNAAVPAAGNVTLRITCTAATEATFEGLVSFNTNDTPGNNPFTFTIRCIAATGNPAQIAVSADGSPVVNGVTLVTLSTTVNTPVSKPITITNTGGQPLNLSGLTINSPFSGSFDGGVTAITVQPGNSVTLTVSCLSATANTFDNTVTFNTNDPNATTFTVPVRCIVSSGDPPQINVNADGSPVVNGVTLVTLPTTTVNTPVSKPITITNTGGQALNLSGLTFNGIFSGSFDGGVTAITVQPGNSVTLTVSCLSATSGTFDGTVTFNSNDPTDTTFTFPVRCIVSTTNAFPDISVSFASVAIANNQAAAVTLGSSLIGVPLVQNIDIANVGTAALTLINLTVTPQAPLQASVNFGSTTVAASGATPLTVTCFSEVAGSYTAQIRFESNDADEDPFLFTVRCNFVFATATFTASATNTGTLSATPTRTPTRTPTIGTRTQFPTVIFSTSFLTAFSATPSLVPTFTPFPTFIFTPFQRTPAPAPACARQAPLIPPTGVIVLANRDAVNVRTVPAIGAPVIGFVNAGYTVEAQARSGDSQWVRVQFAPGQQGWIGLAVLSILSGAVETLPVADPRSIPYGGFDTPRAGLTGATSSVSGRLAQSGLRIRSGPSTNYVILANAPRYSVMPVLGRTADNRWVQLNFEGTLGWAAAEYFEFSSPDVFALPIDGICADAVPLSEGGDSGFFDTLRFLRDRLDLAQPSLDAIRAIWTNVALGGVAQCGNYPIRPTDYNIPQPLLAAYVDRLGPLGTDFNLAMGSIRAAVELLIEACSFAQPSAGSVGQSVVQQALDAVNRADALFADIRRRIAEQLPPDELAPDECLFLYTGQAAVVKRLEVGQPRNAQLTSRPAKYVIGFCFDAPAGQDFRVEILRLSGSAAPRLTVSSFDNPTNFIAQIQLRDTEPYTALQPITITQNGRYLLLVSDLELSSTAGQGDFVVLLTNVTGVAFSAPSLSIDPLTGQILVNPVPSPLIPTQAVPQGGQASGVCPNVSFTCQQLLSCDQALACYLAGNTSLDGDADAIPCENLCGGAPIQPTFDPG